MEWDFETGDLVQIKSSKKEKIKTGIIIDVLVKSKQNSAWSSYLVLCNGWIDAFPTRRLKPYVERSI